MILWVCITLGVIYIVRCLLQPQPEKLHGVYSQPGPWYPLKKLIFIAMYLVRQWKSRRAVQQAAKMIQQYGIGYGQRSKASVDEMECVQDLLAHEEAMDSVYFNGFNKDGTGLVLRLARRHNQIMEVWFLIHLPGIGDLELPLHPDGIVHTSQNDSFSALGLTFEVVEPMRTWKINFNGICRIGIRNTVSEDCCEDQLVHVKFSLLWKAYTDYFDFDTELHPFLIADGVAREPWSKQFFETLQKTHQTHYEQWGQLDGRIYVEGYEERQLSLRGMRDHTYGIRGWKYFHRYGVQMGFMEDGSTFHVGVVSQPQTMSCLSIGYLYRPNGIKELVSSLDMPIHLLGEDGNPTTQFILSFTAGGEKYHLRCEANTTAVFYCSPNWDGIVHERLCTFTLNGLKGWGVSEFEYRHKGGCPVTRLKPPLPLTVPAITAQDEAKLVVPFTSTVCESSHCVGGKGSQLALLTKLQSQHEHQFNVPQGICVTMAAFQLQMKEHENLQKAVSDLENIAHGIEKGDIDKACQMVSEQFLTTDITDSIKHSIRDELNHMFGQKLENTMFAVRSSAIGEDTSAMSAAGQMTTLLAIKGIEKVYQAVSQCWASLFSFQAVQYRRQHGQPVKSTMGVVIQEMVPSHVSGVLFSWHPITGHPNQMVINANYGLGETVVSGTAEPDMITLSSKQDGTFDIISKDVGAKKEKMEVLESGGTSTTSVSETNARQCSLPDDSVFKLANIAKLIERYFGDPRDIEWAVKDDVIYLLQARPITTFEMETEEDLLVEFDSPLAKDDEWVTNANIGEMMPGAVTPLTASIFSRTIESIMQILQQHFGILPGPGTWPIHKCMLLRYSHMFINMHTLGNISTERVSICNKEMGDLALFGRVIHDLTPAMLSQHNGTVNVFRRHLNTFKFIKSQILGWNKLAELQDIARNYHFNNITDTSTASELYQEIHRKLPDYHLAFDDSVTTSSLSGIWSQVVVAILSGGGKNWNTAHFSDMAVLLSDCKDVASAEVPLAMEAVTMAISKSGHTEAFLAMDAGSAAKWLMEDEDSADAGQQFQLFLRKHGHRCIRESEFREPSWGLDPTKVIPIIQTMLKHPYGSDKKTVTVEDAINQLKSPVTVVGKKILKWVVPRARGAVGNRELGKSLAIEVANHFKCAYWKLSEMMVKEGYLPDKDLLFFLTHKEIGKVLTGSPTLVAKAVRRRRAFPNLMDMNFPEISVGLPQTLEDDDEISPTSVQMTGMPVCHGVAKGVARVITNLDDAKNIQSGDILIVCYTDVGWTPYFPLIAGLVTELGGLLSHGAVVAREYGLPCIVNVRRATSVFKSGDYVVLNGVKGTIEKREKE